MPSLCDCPKCDATMKNLNSFTGMQRVELVVVSREGSNFGYKVMILLSQLILYKEFRLYDDVDMWVKSITINPVKVAWL